MKKTNLFYLAKTVLLLLVMACMTNGSYAQSYSNAGNLSPIQGVPNGGGIANPILSPKVTTFGDMASFDAATSGFAMKSEDFQNGGNAFCFGVSPLSSATNDNCFSTGSVQEGFSLSVLPSGGDYVLLPTAFLGLPSNGVGPITFADNTDFTFGPNVHAVSFELVAPLAAVGSTFEVEVFDGATSLGTTDVMSNGATPVFFGLTSQEGTSISKVVITSPEGEIFTSLSYGIAPVLGDPIPTMSEWGLMIFGLLVLNMSVFFIRREELSL